MDTIVDISLVKQRANELKSLLGQCEYDHALRKLLDFAREFGKEGKVNEVILFKSRWKEIADERRKFGRSDENDRLHDRVIIQILELIDEIVRITEEILPTSTTDETDHAIKNENTKRSKDVTSHYTPTSSTVKEVPETNIVLQASNLTKTFKTSSFSISNISIDLAMGKIIGLIGPNASGKTTLLRILSGEIARDTGSLEYPLFPVDDKEWYCIKQQIACISDTLPPWESSLKNTLHYMAAIKGKRGEENKEAVNYIIHRLGLEDYQHLSWDKLSAGYKMRFELARCLVWNPKLLILDEPLANLDINVQQRFLKDLQDLVTSAKYPFSVIISSQHLHEIEAVSDSIIFLKNGTIEFSGTLEDLRKNSNETMIEISCSASKNELKDSLEVLGFLDIDDEKSSYYVIHAPKEILADDILLKLLENGFKITFFRDISGSTKRFFSESETGEGIK